MGDTKNIVIFEKLNWAIIFKALKYNCLNKLKYLRSNLMSQGQQLVICILHPVYWQSQLHVYKKFYDTPSPSNILSMAISSWPEQNM